MADKLAVLKRSGRGQVLAELCLVLPLALFIVLGVLQLLLAGYGACFARFAAFCALRSAAVISPLERETAAYRGAAEALDGVPGVRMVWMTVSRIPVARGAGIGFERERLSCRVRVKVQRVAPFMGFCFVEGGCAMQMEAFR